MFVAPTKPLVAQQIDACHKTCGIPGSHAAELTGQNSRQVRARAVRPGLSLQSIHLFLFTITVAGETGVLHDPADPNERSADRQLRSWRYSLACHRFVLASLRHKLEMILNKSTKMRLTKAAATTHMRKSFVSSWLKIHIFVFSH